MSEPKSGFSRRTVLKGAAWSVPVVAVATAVPLAAASEAPNDEANYFWDSEATGTFATLDPAGSGLNVRFSTRISYDGGNPYQQPPANGIIQITLVFDQPMTLTQPNTQGWVQVTPSEGGLGPSTTFVFQKTPSSQGGDLTLNMVGDHAGPVNVNGTMTLLNGGTTTWSSEVAEASAILVA
ncbi:hypothetical protein L2X99_03810 [Microbacterium sp. KUDC0406]|uniref:hypothetical protein n=1 Tax=Microbacterium sp. KUDC0406 TaxID=2909588 RepID=UPI001F264437|nr:hypothetical protein [Microbacterium sp. KUDC0406]UJP10780.1 hypothetical protein L2X99_03810 [Microbacterium sp. KUDC0406]